MSPFLDPSDPKYSDTPNVSMHPLEGEKNVRLCARPGCGNVVAGRRDRKWCSASCSSIAKHVRRWVAASGYLLVSEAELAEALMAWWADDRSMPGTGSWEADGGWNGDAAAIFAALVKQQEGRER